MITNKQKTSFQSLHLYHVLSKWEYCEKKQPDQVGWYRTQSDKLSSGGWGSLAYFDGRQWWRTQTSSLPGVADCKVPVQVSAWQGLKMPPKQAAQWLRQHLPAVPPVQQVLWGRLAAQLEAPPEVLG